MKIGQTDIRTEMQGERKMPYKNKNYQKQEILNIIEKGVENNGQKQVKRNS